MALNDTAQELKPSFSSSASASVTALWYVAPRECALNAQALPALTAGDCLVRTLWSGVSRGTERLVCEGRVPVGEYERMRAPFQQGDFPFPVKYGYCAVGVVEAGPQAMLGETVFCLHPHQDRFIAPVDRLTRVPADVPARRAILAANMETALNAHWDAGSGPADRIVVVGGGVLGLLVAWLAARLPGAQVTLVDVEPARAIVAQALGFSFALPADAPAEADLVFHASASAPGLATAIAAAGLEARIVELSWYGDGTVPAPLGGAFHAKRLQLVSTQVGGISPSRRPRWDYARRSAAAMALLADDRLDVLITQDVPFAQVPERLPAILDPSWRGLTAAICY
ncbi:zinc-binding alcohol dehydrogenase [Bosea sp. (in: a-proteobacteria)]|uniref:zinc-dependent alcohol dehydrogenase n=1 Tax=Bosea sp. (in: a-proteobacteria) TaxID=1871050 RepID=UPI0027328AEB|nr:zinc-binding alcohol dehydrogenase [Bosea sp. (in: a-proteobacteria)]MDP3407787.1 zinc-binding alcohol dehydrogenase [Bosea sp. (in: a-proteobacteria)]